ncbi:MAG: hypothetical protein HC786_11145 [Richelia sp. CSU_2_1]|nr:hypothetical protein [Richelia sp. CSU_2_1]
MKDFDVGIIGAGVAGAFATLKLAKDHKNVKAILFDLGREIDGSLVEVTLAKPVDKNQYIRFTRNVSPSTLTATLPVSTQLELLIDLFAHSFEEFSIHLSIINNDVNLHCGTVGFLFFIINNALFDITEQLNKHLHSNDQCQSLFEQRLLAQVKSTRSIIQEF